MSSTSDAARWQQLKALLASVLELPTDQRRAQVDALGRDDAQLRAELLSLLDAAEADDDALRRVPSALVAQAVQAHLGAAAGESEDVEPAPNMIAGKRLGPWRLVALIARGGQGEVWRAERADGQFAQQAAIKLLRLGGNRSWVASRFAAERQLLAGLDHPNLARVLDGGTTDDGVPYFVMELVEGEPIDAYCARLALPLAERLALFRTVCNVVGYAHSKGIVHRDLKCDNILVTAAGVVKLVDFGIAKQLNATSETTATAQRMMTLAYSSPEQVRGAHVGPPSDVYSLGVVLYRLLTDASPYGSITADSGYELTRAICDTEPQPPSRAQTTTPRAKRRRLRGDLDALVMMALRKDPARRYADATALGEDIFRHQESLPVRARRGALSYQLNRFVLRHKAVVGAAMLANLALLIGLGVAVWQSVEAKRQQQRAERHLATVREFANVLMFDVHDAVAPIAGSLAARQMLTSKALAYLQVLATDSSGDPGLQTELAVSYRKVGDIQGRPNAPNLGDPTGAIASYDRAIDLLRPLEARAGNVAAEQIRVPLALASGTKAALLGSIGRFDEAHQILIEVDRITAKVLRHAPANVAAMRLRASAFGSISWMLHERGDFEGFLAQAAQGESLLKKIIEIDPNDVEARFALASAHARRSVYFLSANNSAENARKAYDHVLQWTAIVDDLVRLQPANSRLVSARAESYGYTGKALMRMNEPQRATEKLRMAVEELERLIDKDRKDDKLRWQLINARIALASALLEQRRAAPAQAQAQLAIEDHRQLTAASQSTVYQSHSVAQAHYVSGMALAALSAADGGRRTLRRQSCEQFEASLTQLRGLANVPRSSEGELSVERVLGASAVCPR